MNCLNPYLYRVHSLTGIKSVLFLFFYTVFCIVGGVCAGTCAVGQYMLDHEALCFLIAGLW